MKIKKFFIDNKYKFKKLLGFLLSVFGVLIYSFSIFACGYNVKSAFDEVNKKELVDRKEVNSSFENSLTSELTNYDLFSTSYGSIYLGEWYGFRSSSMIKFFSNINFIRYEESVSNNIINCNYEIELTNFINIYRSPTEYVSKKLRSHLIDISFTRPISSDFVECINLSWIEFDLILNGLDYNDVETCDLSLSYEFDLYYEIYLSSGLYTEYFINVSAGFDGSVDFYDGDAYDYSHSFDATLNDYSIIGVIPSIRIFNSYNYGYENGYDNGYDEGVSEEETHYEELIIPAIKLEYEEIGYDKGYLQGKNDTLNDGSGVALFDAFTLIGKGFEAWNPILNMQIIPGFTLGVFIAIPIIIGVVFILIKLLQR